MVIVFEFDHNIEQFIADFGGNCKSVIRKSQFSIFESLHLKRFANESVLYFFETMYLVLKC